uniref:Uncharacterized protein n=1 Tax=Alexandrium monilatum TaxID=311494 RepID=A0A7S4VBC9_9DINO
MATALRRAAAAWLPAAERLAGAAAARAVAAAAVEAASRPAAMEGHFFQRLGHWPFACDVPPFLPAVRATQTAAALPAVSGLVRQAEEAALPGGGAGDHGAAMECRGRRQKGSWGHRRGRGGMKGKRAK